MNVILRLFVVACLGVVLGNSLLTRIAAGADIDFDRQVAPILSRACLDCHNANDRKGGLDLSSEKSAQAGGDTGPALDLTNPVESLLWQRIEAGEMPPKQKLSTTDKKSLGEWLKNGAKWGTSPIDRFRFTSETRAGFDWWSLQPVKRPMPPQVPKSIPVINPIDQFVAAARIERKLPHSLSADRRVLARRAHFDLLGLPPSPEEVEHFVSSSDPHAWTKLIDQLLDRVEYGERWGRHWLDVVRFGESQGFERDKLRTNSWQYRDWVINAWNRDLPYDEFVRMQIAGDVLKPNDPHAVIATGFIVAAPWDEVGQSQQSLAMKMVVRQDELEDVIGTTAQTFLGLTVNCARCHDHKFDPISQAEYYQFAAVLAGIRHGEREATSEQARSQQAATIEKLRSELAAHGRAIDDFDRPFRAKVLAQRNQSPASVKTPDPIARWEFNDDLKDTLGSLHGTAHGNAQLRDGKLWLDGGEGTFVETSPLTRDLREKTLAVWVSLENLSQQGGGAISVQSSSGAVFDAIVYGEREAGQWMAGSNGFVRSQSFAGAIESESSPKWVQICAVYGADQTITFYRNGRVYGSPYKANALATYEKGKSQLLFGMRHSPPGGNRMLAAAIDRAMLFDRALTPDEVAALNGIVSDHVTNDELLVHMSTEERRQRNHLVRRFSLTQVDLTLSTAGKVYAVNPSAPEPIHFLERGNPAQKKALMKPGSLKSASPAKGDFELPTDTTDAVRRGQLAAWMTRPDNPLTARVIVNRLWQYHFGVGLVDTPNDFGFNGGRPTHPELLDWLAAELVDPQIDDGHPKTPWSLKHIHRVIMMSATYCQSSQQNTDGRAIDAGNRYLWRKSPQRLEAEGIRDTILAIAGELNSSVGGPGFQDFRTFTFNSQFYEMLDPVGFDFQRRTVYRTWVRSGRSDFLDVFDCPDPSTTAPRRAITTTPLQALAMLNNSFTLRMSDRFADRVIAEAGSEPAKQVERVALLAWGRKPTQDDIQLGVEFVRQHGLARYCRVIFNSNEFLYVD